jgi:hypothetical protein
MTAAPAAQVGGKCLWFNESAPFVKTDMFVVQGMPGVWDLHCTYEGGGAGVGQYPDLVARPPRDLGPPNISTVVIPMENISWAQMTFSGARIASAGLVLEPWQLLLPDLPVRAVPRPLPQDHHEVLGDPAAGQ